METPVKNWMSGDPISVEPFASALEALDVMVDRGIRHLPVVDAGHRVIGVLSLDDLRAALPFPVSLGTTPSVEERTCARDFRVSDVMTHSPATLTEGDPLELAAQTLADRRIGCLPIVDASGRLAGILSETDVLQALATSLWSDRIRARRGESAMDELVRALRRERHAIGQTLDGYHAAERELSADIHDRPGDLPERAAEQRDVTVLEKLDELAARRLEAIDRALDHAAQGRLGTCDLCGSPIPLGRLRALPGTTICVACARASETPLQSEIAFERPTGGRGETGQPELGGQVYTRFGEGQLLRIAAFGSCRRCGDTEGSRDEERDVVVCGSQGCGQALSDVCERAIVRVGEREVYVEPGELSTPSTTPYE